MYRKINDDPGISIPSHGILKLNQKYVNFLFKKFTPLTKLQKEQYFIKKLKLCLQSIITAD